MFADKIKERFTVGDQEFTFVNTALVDMLFDGTRMVSVHDDVVKAALPLIKSGEEKMRQVSKYTCWPDYNTWIEFKLGGRSIGVYFHGELGKSVMCGHGLAMAESPDRSDPEPYIFPFKIDLERYSMQYCDLAQWAYDRAEELKVDSHTRRLFNVAAPKVHDPIVTSLRVTPFLTELKPILLTLLAFMNSPKLVRTQEVDVGRLNARRLKRGKYPYHPHHEVRLNIDKHDAQDHARPG
jgi:hypothetical protein